MSTEETVAITLTVNSEPVSRMVPVRQHLVDFLRTELGLPARISAASTGSVAPVRCASMGGVRGCLMLAVQADGSEVHDHRGPDRQRRGCIDLQEAFVARNAAPVRILHARHADDGSRAAGRTPSRQTREEIRTFCPAIYCRCTGYHAIVDAVAATLAMLSARVAGHDATRPCTPCSASPTATSAAPCPATGPSAPWPAAAATPTTSSLPRMLHAAFVRSPFAHARILAIDTAEAKRHPGVALVMTGTELAKLCTGPWVGTLTCFPGMKSAPQYPMAVDRACWVGRTGGDGGRAHARPGRGRGRADRHRLGRAAGGHREEDRARSATP